MKIAFFPPFVPPLPMDCFMSEAARAIVPFNPGPVNFMIDKYAAGLANRPTAEQLRDWMNKEEPVPSKYHETIRDIVGKMTGENLMVFRQNAGSSIRGFAHLVHSTGAFSDIAVHYIDSWSDIGDKRPRWDRGYCGRRVGL